MKTLHDMKNIMTLLPGLLLIVSTTFGQTEIADTTSKIKPCAEAVNYSVDDILLRTHLGQNLTGPGTNPSFDGGPGELKKYFVSHALTNKKAKDIVFRVHIGFLVNCNGQAGNFQIVSKGKGDLQE